MVSNQFGLTQSFERSGNLFPDFPDIWKSISGARNLLDCPAERSILADALPESKSS